MRLGHPLVRPWMHKREAADQHHARRGVDEIDGDRTPPREQEAAHERSDGRRQLKPDAPPHRGIGKDLVGHQARHDRRCGGPAERAKRAGAQEKEVHPAERRVRERCPGQPHAARREPRLADHDDRPPRIAIGRRPGRHRQQNHRQGEHQPDVAKIDRFARAVINFPPHRHGPHLVSGVREHRPDEKQQIARLPQRRNRVELWFSGLRHGAGNRFRWFRRAIVPAVALLSKLRLPSARQNATPPCRDRMCKNRLQPRVSKKIISWCSLRSVGLGHCSPTSLRTQEGPMNRLTGSFCVGLSALTLAAGTSVALADLPTFHTNDNRLPTPQVPYNLIDPPANFGAGDNVTLYSLQLQAQGPRSSRSARH